MAPLPKAFARHRLRRRLQYRASCSGRSTRRMPMPPPPGCRFDQKRKSDLPAAASSRPSRSPSSNLRLPGTTGTPARDGDIARPLFVAHIANGLRRRADPGQSGAFDCFGESGILRQKAIAGMDRVARRSAPPPQAAGRRANSSLAPAAGRADSASSASVTCASCASASE